MDLCNLYPLLVHVNLFEGGYVSQVQGTLRRFT
jgi:fructosamine-3-kinase